MSSSSIAMEDGHGNVNGATEKHPPGLYVLFATEMWERFSFYSMLALFTLYMQNGEEGFGWTAAEATTLYSWYLMFVYFSPLLGGLIADKVTGYRKAVMIGGFFFMAGHLLLSFRSLPIVYLSLVCLVIGNGFFKPNVSAMVGNLYKEGSHLKDRAYNIFYLGINVGAFLAPLVMEAVKSKVGNHPAFAVAAVGMLVSVTILWRFKKYVAHADHAKIKLTAEESKNSNLPIDQVPDWKRIAALIVIFLIVIVFWMVFHQNSSTLTYWADDNTAWNVSGTISNAINPFWILTLTFPLVWFWQFLDRKGMEPSTPTKMTIGMFLTGLSFVVLYFAATTGEGQQVKPDMFATGSYRVNDRVRDSLKADGVPDDVLQKLMTAKDADGKFIVYDKKFAPDDKASGEQQLTDAIGKVLTPAEVAQHKTAIMQRTYIFKVSPFWLILAYMILTLGELMLSPMGLALVSKVAPQQWRGLLMGGWFAATAIGNKLTMIGVYWGVWKQSSFFIVLAGMAFFMGIVLFLLLRPLKKAMPGV